MFSQSLRLPSPNIAPTMRKGKRIHSDVMDLTYQTSSHPSRFGVIVSSKIDKRATARNRMKRLVREALRRLLPFAPQGVDGVIVVRKRLPDSEVEVEKIIKDLLVRV